MAQPIKYIRSYDFTAFQSVYPSQPLPSAQLDANLDQVAVSVNQTINRVMLIQRDDGKLRNQLVNLDALSNDVRALFGSSFNPMGVWVTATEYKKLDMVSFSGVTYLAVNDHLSSAVFADDLDAGHWLLFSNAVAAAGSSFFQAISGNGIDSTFNLTDDLGVDSNAVMAFYNDGTGWEPLNPSSFTLDGLEIEFDFIPVFGSENIFLFAPSLLLGAASAAAADAQAAAVAAAGSASTSATQAGIATTQAGIATTQATAAAGSATTATTQAGIATTQATAAAVSATTATTQATTATTQAGIATTAATTATTQAGIATTQAGIATTQAGIATTQAGIATTAASTATTEAATATTQAGIATTQAGIATAAAAAAEGITELTGDAEAVGPGVANIEITDQFTGGFRKMYEKVSRTIASGVIAVNSTAKTVEIVVDTEGGAVLDDLTSITGGIIGQELILRTTSSARDIVVVNNQAVGGIYLPDSKNVLLATGADRLTVVYMGNTNGLGTWVQKSLSKITDAGTYEQGDWTPTIEGTTVAGVQTYGSVAGKYIRVGNMVTISGRVAISAKGGTMAGNVKVGGLPFPVGTGAYASTMPYSTGVTLTSGEWLNCIFNSGNDHFFLFKNNGSANAALTVANIANATEFRFNLTYYIGD